MRGSNRSLLGVREFADWEEDQLRAVGALAGQPGSTVADLTATLARVGCSLFEQLLPKTLQELCWTFRQRGVKTLLILSGRIGFSLTRLGSWGGCPAGRAGLRRLRRDALAGQRRGGVRVRSSLRSGARLAAARFGHIDEWHVDVRKSQSKNEMCKKASLA
jgi:hypothetical protein